MEVKKYIDAIIETKDTDKMMKLGCMFEDLMHHLKKCNEQEYIEYKICLYEILNGEKLTEEKAGDWIRSMRPYGMKWTIEQSTEAMKEYKYDCDKVDFWAMMNAMYNDYKELFDENVETYAKLSYLFIKDEDALPNKTYKYWKEITKK